MIESLSNLAVAPVVQDHGSGVLFSTGHSAIGASSPTTGAMPVLYVGTNGKTLGQYWSGAVDTDRDLRHRQRGTWHEVDLIGAATSETMYLDGVEVGSVAIDPANLDPMDFAGAGLRQRRRLGQPAGHGSTTSTVSQRPTDLHSRADRGQVTAMYSTNNAALTLAPYSPGPHTLYVDAVDAAGDVSSTYSYPFLAADHASITCTSLAACFDNTGISTDADTGEANLDQAGNSLSATALSAAGWSSGGTRSRSTAPP